MNRLSIVRILLHAGADLDLADTHGSTAEALSVSKKLTAMTELFVSERYRRALPSHTGIVRVFLLCFCFDNLGVQRHQCTH